MIYFMVGYVCVRCAIHDYYNMNSLESNWAQLQNVYGFYIAINKKYAVPTLLWH